MLLGLHFFVLLVAIEASQQPNQLIPPLSPVRNVTGSLNTFIEQVQEMNPDDPPVIIMGNRASQILQPVPIPVTAQNYPAPVPAAAPALQAPVSLFPAQQPSIDPALQRLLNSFNTVPVAPQAVAYSLPGQPATVVSYVTCYVGCSHVTNVVSSSHYLKPSIGLLALSLLLTVLL